MDNSQKNKLSMFLAVLGIMETNDAVWTPLTGIADMVTRLEDLTTDIQTSSGVQGTKRTGIAEGKNRKQVLMINLTLGVAGDLHSYAVKQGDDVMAAQTDLEESDLVRLGDGEVGPRCQQIYLLAQANAAALAPRGTTAADLTALQAAISDYGTVTTAPRQAVASNTSVTSQIATDVAAGMSLLKNELDKAMVKFKGKNPAFYQAYKDARVIVDLGVVHEKKPELVTPTPPAP